MNKTVKFSLILTASILVIGLGLSTVGALAWQNARQMIPQPIDNDPRVVEKAGKAIADYTLPAGFGDGFAVTAANLSLVTYTTVDDRAHIYLVQMAATSQTDTQQLKQQMDMTVGKKGWAEVQVIDSQPCHIRGEETTLVISEGINHEGRHYRSASAIFSGKNGTALVNISGPSSSWDQAMVETFIASLH